MNKCIWIKDKDLSDNRYWDTECGEAFYISEGTLKDNSMRYCCFCGKLIEEKK